MRDEVCFANYYIICTYVCACISPIALFMKKKRLSWILLTTEETKKNIYYYTYYYMHVL